MTRRLGNEVVAVCPNCFEDNIACNIHITKEGFHCSTCKELGSMKQLFEFFAEEYFNLDALKLVETYLYTDVENKDLDICVGKYKTPEGKRFYTYNPVMLRRPMLFALPIIQATAKKKNLIVFVDGEKDANILTHKGVLATTSLGGSYNYGLVSLALLDLPKNSQIILCGKADLHSMKYITKVGVELKRIGFSPKIITPEMMGFEMKEFDGDDISTWVSTKGNNVRELIANAIDFSILENMNRQH